MTGESVDCSSDHAESCTNTSLQHPLIGGLRGKPITPSGGCLKFEFTQFGLVQRSDPMRRVVEKMTRSCPQGSRVRSMPRHKTLSCSPKKKIDDSPIVRLRRPSQKNPFMHSFFRSAYCTEHEVGIRKRPLPNFISSESLDGPIAKSPRVKNCDNVPTQQMASIAIVETDEDECDRNICFALPTSSRIGVGKHN